MIEEQLADLIARESIRDLPLRYCDCVWRDDIDGILDLFSTDGCFIAVHDGAETNIAGHTALREFYIGGIAMKPRPYIHNHVIELRGPSAASGRCYLDLRSANRDMAWIGAGYYEDDYVLESGMWKFRTRRFIALHMDVVPAGFKS